MVGLDSSYGNKMVILVSSVIPLESNQGKEESDTWK